MATRPPARPTKFVIVENHPQGPSLRGAAQQLWRSTDHEVMIAGPSETGKTFAALLKLDALMLRVPGAQAVLVRKTQTSIFSSVLQTYQKRILHDQHPARPYGGDRPMWYDYPGGGRLWIAGLDDPGKALSSERDFVYVNQCEELTADDWQVLTTRATGRAGNTKYPQVIGDCNPGPPHHWIKHRPSLRLLESRHEDNPSLYDDVKKKWTEQGRRTLAVLDNLHGVRKERLRYGRWVSAEGTVYEFDPSIHLIDNRTIPDDWTRFRTIDFGYTNPFVCQWWAIDLDGRLYLYREIYMTGRTVRVHAQQIKALSQSERYAATIADHDAEDRATLSENGISTTPANKAIMIGIQAIESRLGIAGDGRARLFIMRNALVERDEGLADRKHPISTEQEFDAYTWPKGGDGKPVKETPVDLYNHGMDSMRYGVVWADRRGRLGNAAFTSGPAMAFPQF